MSLPQQIDPTDPLITALASGGAAELRGIKQFLADLFGFPVAPATITGAVMSVAGTGAPTLVSGSQVAADPTQPLGVATKRYVDSSFASVSTPTISGASNLRGQTTGTWTIGYTADQVLMRNPSTSAGLLISALNATVNISSAQSGPQAGGRDQSALFGSNQFFHVYAIGGGGNPAALIASVTTSGAGGPTLPGTYTSFAYLGTWLAGASAILAGFQVGSRFFYNFANNILSGGQQTVPTLISMALFVPAVAQVAHLQAVLGMRSTFANGEYIANFSYDGTHFFSSVSVGSNFVNDESVLNLDLQNTANQLFYELTSVGATASNGALTLNVLGYDVPAGAS